MDHPAALHRIKVGVPATVEHSSEAGPETGKWVAETTQVYFIMSDDASSFLLVSRLPSFRIFLAPFRTSTPPGASCHCRMPTSHADVDADADADIYSVQSFITFMDALKLRLRAKDQLHPLLQDLVTGYARFKGSKDWEGRSKMVSWYVSTCFDVY
jgi:hypothetical protein